MGCCAPISRPSHSGSDTCWPAALFQTYPYSPHKTLPRYFLFLFSLLAINKSPIANTSKNPPRKNPIPKATHTSILFLLFNRNHYYFPFIYNPASSPLFPHLVKLLSCAILTSWPRTMCPSVVNKCFYFIHNPSHSLFALDLENFLLNTYSNNILLLSK